VKRFRKVTNVRLNPFKEEIDNNMKGKFKLLGHIGLALFLVSALMLAFMPAAPVQAATAVTDVWVEFPSTDAGGLQDLTFNQAEALLMVRVHFKPTTAMVAGVDTITVQFPDGVDTTMGTAGTTYAFSLGAACTTAANFDIDPDGPGTTHGYDDAWVAVYGGKRLTVTTAVPIAAGQEAWLLIDDAATMVTGGVANTTAYKVKVHTSKDTTPVLSKGFYLGATAGQVATTDVSVSPDTAGAENAQWTFTFDPDGATLAANTDTITVTFPYGTTLPSSIAASNVSVCEVSSGSWYTCGVAPTIDTDLRTVKVTTPFTLTDAAGQQLRFASAAGITNPTKAATDYGDDATTATTRVAFIRTSDDARDTVVDASGFTINESAATMLDFGYATVPGYSDKYTMINMYSSELYLQVEDAYGNLCDTGSYVSAEVTLESSSASGNFYIDGTGSYTAITATQELDGSGAKTIYYKDTAAGTYTLTASYSGLTSCEWTFQVCPGVSLYDRYDNLINTYKPTASTPVEETAVCDTASQCKGGYYVDQAIDEATEYDTVKLGDGRYELDSTTTQLTIDDNYVTLTSVNGAASTTIYDTDDTGAAPVTIQVSANYATVDGLTVQNTSTHAQARVISIGSQATEYYGCTLSNCIIKGPSTYYYPLKGDTNTFGVVLTDGGTAGNTVSNNTISNAYMGIYARSSDTGGETCRNTFSGNNISATALGINIENNDYATISDNTVSASYSVIQLYNSDYNTVSGNTVSGAYSGASDGISTNGGGIELQVSSWNNTIVKNTISGCYYGVRVNDNTSASDTCANNVVKYNDISGDTRYGIYCADTTATYGQLDAKYNYFGDATGPTYTALTGAEISKSNPNGTGDAISDFVVYYPWLYKSVTDVVADNVSYQTSIMKLVLGGWNTLSTPVQLIAAADSIDELISADDMEIGYYYDAGWQLITTGYVLSPCNAVYIKMKSTASTAYLQFKFDASAYSWPSKDLAVGWNLISLASLDSDGKQVDHAVASVYKTAANLPGYAQVVSPSLNATQYDMYYNAGGSWSYSSGETWTAGTMYAGLGYWIYMQNAATLAGFEITPIAPDLD